MKKILLLTVLLNPASFVFAAASSSQGMTLEQISGKEFATLVRKGTNATSLELSGRYINDDGLRALCKMLKSNKTVTYLNLSDNNISDDGASAIYDLLVVNRKIKALVLSSNNIGDAGLIKIAAALSKKCTLESLTLSKNVFSIVGLQALAESLTVNNTIRSLLLEENKLGDVGAQVLAAALPHNHSLILLSLCINNITDIGARYLADALKSMDTLENLSLWGNPIDALGKKEIIERILTRIHPDVLLSYLKEANKLQGDCHFIDSVYKLETRDIFEALPEAIIEGLPERDAEYIFEAIHINNSLVSLNFSRDRVPASVCSKIDQAICRKDVERSRIICAENRRRGVAVEDFF